ncbi:uncharacterized protein LDX57_005926 [Aspergillus melleus]|uniref:uncharacterized protein n=1 Tax=Aspergillus melleus TaxID=138277 RepID=UPI001E8EEC42|nr:uncharacterized protein LDX57_005926 [Aspergillus melleus]KAH8428223.1 hypothetical protein LDX57_005926 [Aspergillus melleus]
MRMPKPKERFLWVDLTYPIRGIYMPSAFHGFPLKKYEKWTRYVFVKFNQASMKLTTFRETFGAGTPQWPARCHRYVGVGWTKSGNCG